MTHCSYFNDNKYEIIVKYACSALTNYEIVAMSLQV